MQKIGKTQRRKSLHSFSAADHIQPISKDPESADFMAFRVVRKKKYRPQRELSRFRADNIVHMRNFMASLGASGMGLFSPKGEDEIKGNGILITSLKDWMAKKVRLKQLFLMLECFSFLFTVE